MASHPFYAYPCEPEEAYYYGGELSVTNYSVNLSSEGQWIFRGGHGEYPVEKVFCNADSKPAFVLCRDGECFRIGREVALDRGWVLRLHSSLDLL